MRAGGLRARAQAGDAEGKDRTRAKADQFRALAELADSRSKRIKAKRDRIATLVADPNTTLGHKRASVRSRRQDFSFQAVRGVLHARRRGASPSRPLLAIGSVC